MCLFFVPQNKWTFLMLQSLPRKMVHLPSLRSRMTGRYLLPFCKTLLRVCSHLFSLFHVYSHLPLPTANAATFPDKRGRLTVYILFFFAKKSFNTTPERHSLVPSFLSGGQIRNDDRRKEYNVTLSEESGIG